MQAGLFLIAIKLNVIFGLLCAQNSWAFAVSPATVDAYKRGAAGLTFMPSAALPIVNGVSTVSSASVQVGGATRYLPVAARFRAAAATVAARAILGNPYLLVGTAALAYYQSRGVGLVGNTLRKPGSGSAVFEGSIIGSMRNPYGSLGDYESALRSAADSLYSSSLLTWVKDFKCVQSDGPKGPYRTDCTFQPMYIYRDNGMSMSHFAQASLSAPVESVSQSSPPATLADLPTSAMPPYYDVPTPLPVAEPMVLNPSPQAQSQPFEFRTSDSVLRPDGKYVTTVVTATAAGNAADPSLVDLTSRQVVTDQPSALTDAKKPVVSSSSALDNVAGVPGDGPQPPIVLAKDGADGKDGVDGKDAKDVSPLCELFPSASACAELGSVDDVELPKSDPSAGITLGRLGSFAGGIGRCPAPTTIKGISVDFWRPFCGFVEGLRPLLLTLASLSALMIAFGLRGRDA